MANIIIAKHKFVGPRTIGLVVSWTPAYFARQNPMEGRKELGFTSLSTA